MSRDKTRLHTAISNITCGKEKAIRKHKKSKSYCALSTLG